MKKILYLHALPHDDVGGIEEKILSMAAYLAENRIMIPVLATNEIRYGFAERFRNLGLKVYEVPFYKSMFERRAALEIEKIVEREEITLLQSHMFRESVAGRWVRARNPNVRHIYRVHIHFEIPYLAKCKWKRWLYYRLESLSSGNVDRYVTISDLVRNNLIKHTAIPEDRIEVVHNGILPMGDCDPPNVSNNPLSAKAVIIARYEEGKQQMFAIEFVDKLRKEGIDMELHLVGGDGPDIKYKSNVQILARKLGMDDLVHFYGYCSHDEILNIVRNIPVVMLPSLSEGMPTSILEGMSLRKLVMVSDGAGATCELVRHNVNGLLLNPRDKEQWVQQLKDVFTTPARIWEPIRNAGYETWKKHYSLEAMMEGMMNVYRSMDLLS